jgi:hypothetical protein
MFKAGNKLIWELVIVFTAFIGTIIYLAVGRPRNGGRAAAPLRRIRTGRRPSAGALG